MVRGIMSLPYQKAYFLLSAQTPNQLPADFGQEVAIVGRSNSGKSSVLNCLTYQKSLARVSKTPGRTQLINVFSIDAEHRFIDLPGYGYAAVPLAVKRRWEQSIDQYLRERQSLKGLILVMDIRHPLRELDQMLIQFCEARMLPVHALLNKADKLSKLSAKRTLQQVESDTKHFHSLSCQLFSAHTGAGLERLKKQLDEWYGR